MRYHELAKELGVEPEALTEAIAEKTGAAKPVAVASVPTGHEAYLRQKFAQVEKEGPATETERVEIPAVPEQVNVLTEEGEPEPDLIQDAEAYAERVAHEVLESLPEHWLDDEAEEAELVAYELPEEVAVLSEADIVAKYGVDEEDMKLQEAGHPMVPPEDRFAILDDRGAYRETLKLDPDAAEKLRVALKGRSICAATLYPVRRELVVVTWPCYFKMAVAL